MQAIRQLRTFNRSVQLLFLNQLAIMTGFSMLMPYLTGYLTTTLGFAAWTAGLVLGLRTFSQQGLSVIGGTLADHVGYKPLIAALNQTRNLRHLIVETAFPDEQHGLALASRHLSPSLLGAMLDELEVSPQVYISHLKPGVGERIMAQIACYAGRIRPRALVHGEILEF